MFVIVDGFVKATPGFSTPGWSLFGVTATAISVFITYNWLQGLRQFF